MSRYEGLTRIIGLLRNITCPRPLGYMDADLPIQVRHIIALKEDIHLQSSELSKLKDGVGSDVLQFFYLIFEMIDYFGINGHDKEIQIETYSFGMEFLNIFGILYRYSVLNPQGTRVLYKQISLLDNQFLLYQDLFPDLFNKVETLCPLSTTNTDVMKVTMSICIFHTALTRIVVNHDSQVSKEGQLEHLSKAMEHVLSCSLDFLRIIPKESISGGLKNMLWELIYRIELSPHIFYGVHEFIATMEQFISPVEREKQEGRMSLRVALVSAEMDLRQVLIALRCFQFNEVIQICQTALARLDTNGYFTSNHAGAGAMCFTGFSLKLNEIAHQIILIYEEMCLWAYFNARAAGEIVAKVLITIFNLPAKKGWEGPWGKLNERVINLINTMEALNESETFTKLFDQ